MTSPTGWQSYDSVAAEYERLTPMLFGRLAEDLVALLNPAPAALVLDAGTGTGTAAAAVARRLGAKGAVVGVDPSPVMLRLARGRAASLVVGALPGLPFGDARFDFALANLVLSHLSELEAGAADLARVIRPGGRLGVTAWPEDRDAPDSDAKEASRLLDDALSEVGLPTELPDGKRGAPSEEWLKEEGNVRELLVGAGLTDLELEVHTYTYKRTPGDFLGMHAWAGRGRYLRATSDEATLGSFERRARAVLEERFPDAIRMVSHARVAVGTKPS